MNEEQTPQGSGSEGEQEMSPEQQEMMRQMEEEMRRVRVQDMITQSAASLLNLAARRISKEDERDLEQGRLGIEAVRRLVDLLEPDPQREVKNALSQLQMLYAQHTGEEVGGGEGSGDASGGAGGQRPGSSGLWTPGS